uniref:Synaptotagmin-like protein 2 n=1 Tax=Tetraodon nigroviridis TaxID=99883 RepID=H3CT51_TETNG
LQEQPRGAATMIDLSFLTEEEQEIIQEVLKRDELKKAEEQRIRNLQKTVSDRGLLRYLTGEWFYETKQRRHRERIHSADIIRASMRQAQRPPTTRESVITLGNASKAVHGQHIDESPSHEGNESPIGARKVDKEQEVARHQLLDGTSLISAHRLTLPQDRRIYPRRTTVWISLEKMVYTEPNPSSFPVLQVEEQTDSDSTFEASRQRRNTSSSVSNFSLSSGLNSMSSVADGGDLEVRGSLQFAVNYIQKLAEFHVFVVNCRDLAVADVKKKRSDPYVKCYLLPDQLKLGKRKTTVKKKTSHPTFNEILRFKILLEELKTQNLNMSVWHNDTFGRNSFLGEVDVDLSEWDFGNTQINEYALQARASAQPSPLPDQRLVDNRGQMRVAVRFLPQTSHSKRTSRTETGEVQIWVKDCKNLPPVRGVTIDPFVKCAVLPDTSRKSRQKTRVVKRTSSPMFNHTMVYDGFRTEDLREACVEITVWDHDRLHHHFVGGLRLGLGTGKSYGVDVAWMDSTSDEADLWQRMLQSVGEWVEDILPLRMLMMAKCK